MKKNTINMKSPFIGGKVTVYAEKRTAKYRNQEFEYIFLCYQCVDTKEKFTTTELDSFNTLQVCKQYKKRFETSRGEKNDERWFA